MTTEPKFKRPVKTANGWPGVTKLNFSHPGIQYPWKFHCPQALCFYHIVAATEEILTTRIENHPCPWYGGGTTTFSWGVMAEDFLRPIWEKLDDEVRVVCGEYQEDWDDDKCRSENQAARFRARGLAEALAVLMPPFFTSSNDIVKEAIVRFEKKKAGEDYETPGLGRFRYARPPGIIGDPDNPSWVTKPEYDAKEAPPPVKHSLSDEDVAKIKASTGFPPKMLAAAYNTTEAIVKSIQGK